MGGGSVALYRRHEFSFSDFMCEYANRAGSRPSDKCN